MTNDEVAGNTPSNPAQSAVVPCTAIDNDWGDDRPNLLMHPPCECPRCAPVPAAAHDEGSWLQLPGQQQRLRVEPAQLGQSGHASLG